MKHLLVVPQTEQVIRADCPIKFPLINLVFIFYFIGFEPAPHYSAAVCTRHRDFSRNSATARLGVETYRVERVASHPAG